ncbi:hypothetical protein D3C86_2129540 [compost metagenome]
MQDFAQHLLRSAETQLPHEGFVDERFAGGVGTLEVAAGYQFQSIQTYIIGINPGLLRGIRFFIRASVETDVRLTGGA